MISENCVSLTVRKGILDAFSEIASQQKVDALELIEKLNKSKGISMKPKRRPLSPQKAIKRLTEEFKKHPKTHYSVLVEDLLSLFMVLWGPDKGKARGDLAGGLTPIKPPVSQEAFCPATSA